MTRGIAIKDAENMMNENNALLLNNLFLRGVIDNNGNLIDKDENFN